MKFEHLSYNFSVAKVIAILIVASGHFFKGFWWVPVTNALFVFAFSSGFFTSKKYASGFSKQKFWTAKISRLVYPILVINFFLFALFTVKGVDGIYTWQTIPSLFGLNGFIDWFNIVNTSPFGSGLWFFTLLILFYVLYPIISLINNNQILSIIFLLLSLITTYALYYIVPLNHVLFLSMFAFIFGAYTGKYSFKFPPLLSLACFFISYILMFYLSLFLNYKSLNYFLVHVSSIAIVGYLLHKKLPTLIIEKILLLTGCVIEIYFIHTYLFIDPTRNHIFDYIVSMLIIVTIAYLLSKVTAKLRSSKAFNLTTNN